LTRGFEADALVGTGDEGDFLLHCVAPLNDEIKPLFYHESAS